MDLRLKQERVESFACVLDRTVEDVFTSDVVVPDTLEDVGEILLTDGDFCLWRLDLGSGSAEAEGEWSGSVCYRAENDGSLQHFPVKVGVRLRMHDDAIEPDLRPFAVCRVTDCSAQIMNTRKLRFKVRASLSLQGYALQTMEITSGVEEAPENLFFKTEQMTASVVTDVSEQVFTAGERITLREAPEEGGLLAFHSEIAVDQPQRSGARVILHGVVRSTVFYQGRESSAPIWETIETAFSQLLDLDNMEENDSVQCRLQLTSADLILHEGADLETDFHIVVQTICSRETQMQYLFDAYSVSDGLELQTETIQCVSCGSTNTLTASAEAKLPDTADGASMFSVMSQFASVRTIQNSVSGTATVTVMLSDSDGVLHSKVVEAQFEQALPENNMLRELRLGQPVVSKASGELQVRVPVQMDCVEVNRSEKYQITAIRQIDGDSGCSQRPSLTLIPRSDNMDLWETAKRYGSSIEAIRTANNFVDGEKMPEYCIIPRLQIG